MLYRRIELSLRLTRSGQLTSWLGPALRGTVARTLKRRVCRQPPEEREARCVHCEGCPLMKGCAYGETFEADPRDASAGATRKEEPARPVVLAPYFPAPDEGEPGLDLPVRVTLIGSAAIGHEPELVTALAQAGSLPQGGAPEADTGGLGPDRVTFNVLSPGAEAQVEDLASGELPNDPGGERRTHPRVGVGLTAPLFLRPWDRPGGRRTTVERPEFHDLFRAAVRTVTHLFALYDRALTADCAALCDAARTVRRVDDCYEPFRQGKWRSRSEQHFEMRGVMGGGVYADVPASLLPWLLWGGRLHVGTHRVAGAGCWRLVLD